MLEENKIYGKGRIKIKAMEIFEEEEELYVPFKVKKDKKIKRKDRREDQTLKSIRSLEDAEEWEKDAEEDKY
jgi:hypothetical protein